MQRSIRNLLIAQVVLTCLVATGFLFAKGAEFMWAAFYGGAILMTNTVLMGFRFQKAETAEGQNFALAMYAGVVQRFIITFAGFAIGIGWLKLAPVPQIVAFAAGYIGFIVAARLSLPAPTRYEKS